MTPLDDAALARASASGAARRGLLAELSMAALANVTAAGTESVAAAAVRLYTFGRLPMSAWRRLGMDQATLRAELAGAATAAWLQVAAGPPDGPWWSWRPRLGPAAPPDAGWKLYVSPQAPLMTEAVRATLGACVGLPVVSVKCGGDASGMLRPDKLVVHLATQQAVHALAERLQRELDGCPVHGVPFTAALGGDGLLSWGRDPPLHSHWAAVGPSWRSWVTWLLAEGLAAPSEPSGDACQAALRSVARAGVDPLTWAAADDIWTRRMPG